MFNLKEGGRKLRYSKGQELSYSYIYIYSKAQERNSRRRRRKRMGIKRLELKKIENDRYVFCYFL
jgi:RNA polymerase-binding transcription factor DksA